MSLNAGTCLGPYEIVEMLGAGGMGEVYKARDTRLDRTVAIKILPADLASDPDLRARFEREARAIAALDHPHICAIYDVGESVNPQPSVLGHAVVRYLVMQYLDGETLAARLARTKSPLSPDEALKVGIEIADALDKAHRAGITHRDLKPANIMLTKSGAKLLDFGLAKLRGPAAPMSMSGMTRLATATPNTATGTILGTVHYMAPEQVEGRDADARADIWALGVVLYETLTGTRPFDGESAASVIGSILKDAPSSIVARQPLAPALVDRLVLRCLEKDREHRWQTAADFHSTLTLVRESASDVVGAGRRRPTSIRSVGVATSAVLAIIGLTVAALVVIKDLQESAPAVLRLSVTPPAGVRFSGGPSSVMAPQIAISPDGHVLAFVAERPRSRPALWVRPLNSTDARMLAGTEDARYPFWSPDSRTVGFFARGKLKTVDLAGGQPRSLTDANVDSRGGAWGGDGTIVYAPNPNGVLYRISATGGRPAPVTSLDKTREENGHRFPSFLPDGRHFLFATRAERPDNWSISIGALDSPPVRPLLDHAGWKAQYVAPGYILFVRGSTLMAQRFEPRTLSLRGDAVSIADSVGVPQTSYAAFSASDTGVLAYAPRFDLRGELRWFDRHGLQLEVIQPPAEYLDFELAPDGRSVAASRLDPDVSTAGIWLIDLSRGISSRLTSTIGNNANVVWAPDSSRVVFKSNRAGRIDVYEKIANSGSEERLAFTTGGNVVTTDWSRDSRYIVYMDTGSTGSDISLWPTFGDRKPFVLVHTPLDALHGRLSPDGKWIAYASDESGELQVYVQPVPPTGERRQLSSDGGSEPRWRGDGAELFYLATDRRLMSVVLRGANPFNPTVPVRLFDTRVPLTGNPYRSNYTVTPDGQRFLVNTRVDEEMLQINIVSAWPQGLVR